MRRSSLASPTGGGARRGSLASPKRVNFDDGKGSPQQLGSTPKTAVSPVGENKQAEIQEDDAEKEKVLDLVSLEIALALECRDTIFSLLGSEIDEFKPFRPSYLIPLLDNFANRSFSDDDLRILADPTANTVILRNRIEQAKSESQQKDGELSRAKEELSKLLAQFHDCLDEQAHSSTADLPERRESESQQPNLNALLPHQHRPSFIEKREHQRLELWRKWSGNRPFPYETMSHLLVPDQRGVDFSKANKSALQLISIPFKPRVWQEEGAGDGRTKEKSKLEEIKYDALRRRHKSLHGADLKSLNLGDFALSFPDLARAVPQMQCLQDEDIEALDEAVVTQDYQENGLIVRQGQAISSVFFVGAGAVTCTTTVVSPIYGMKTCSHTLSKGDFFGNSDKAVGTYMSTGHVLLFAIPQQLLHDTLAKYDEPMDEEFSPSWDEASLISHVEQFLQYLLMFTEEEKKAETKKGGLNLPGGERLFGNATLSRKSIFGGVGRANNRGGSLTTRGTISQFLAPNRSSVADEEIINPELKKALMFEMLSSSAPEFDLLETIDNMIRLTKEFFRVDRVGLFRINKLKSTMSLRMSQSQDAEAEVPLRGIAGHIAQTGKVLNIPDCYQNELFDSSQDQRLGYKTTQMLCVPAFAGADNLTGVLQCINTEDGLPFTKSDETLCFMIAQQIGQTLGTLLDRETSGDFCVTHRLSPDVKASLRVKSFVYAPPVDKKKPKAKPPRVKEVMVTVSLVHGVALHPVSHSSKYIAANADGSFTLDFVADYDLRDLPLASRLLVQLTTKDTLSRRPVAWCGLSLYSFERQLCTAAHTINTWDGAIPDGTIGALEKNPGCHEASFIECELSCSSTLPVFYELPHSGRVNVERGADLYAANSLLNDSLTTGTDGQVKDLGHYVEKMSPEEKKRFRRLAHVHPSTANLTEAERDTVWRLRRYLVTMPQYLPAFLLAVDWLHLESVSEAYRLLGEWAPPGRFVALQLLGAVYSDPKVRAYAVEIVSSTTDEEFYELLAPLVHQLRFEVSYNCALARLLLRRALNAPKTIGHALFWQLQAGIHLPELAHKFKFYSNMYLRCCGDEQRTAHAHALLLLRILRSIANDVAAERGGTKKRLSLLRRRLREERPRLPAIFQHPCDPSFQVKGFVPQACYVMERASSGSRNAASAVLYLVMENAVRGGRPFAVQFRANLDPRPELLSAQLALTMDAILKDAQRHVHHSTTEFRGPIALEKAADAEDKAGQWDLCLSDVKSSWISLGDSVLYEVPADAVSFNYIVQAVKTAALRGGGERPPEKKLKEGEKIEVAVAPSAKLAGRSFPVDCVDNWLKICNLDPLSSHLVEAPDAPGSKGSGTDPSPQQSHSQRVGLKGGSVQQPRLESGGSFVRIRRNAFSGPSSARVRGPDGALRYEVNPAHTRWKDTFAKSLAGFYLSSMVMGLRDRNADNILIRASGHIVNIECAALGLGDALGASVKAERQPGALLPQFVYVLGRADSQLYQTFERHLLGGFSILRRYLATLSNIVEITVGGQGIAMDSVKEAMAGLAEHFFMDCEDADEATERFRKLVNTDKAVYSQCFEEATYPAAPMTDGYFW